MEKQVEEVQNILAGNIRSARNKLGYSQQFLAERADLSTGHVNDLEQGRKWISAKSLSKLATALQLEPFMLLIPPEYSSELDRFNLLTNFTMSVKERIEGVMNESLTDILRRTANESQSETGEET